MLLEPTSPLTESTDIDDALEELDSHRDIADSIVGVSKVEATHPVFDVKINSKGLIKPFYVDDFSKPIRRQDIPEVYFFDGSIYLSDVPVLLLKKAFIMSELYHMLHQSGNPLKLMPWLTLFVLKQ